jgi:tripartite-type tricarboxylate transporter receptor subunit TctC
MERLHMKRRASAAACAAAMTAASSIAAAAEPVQAYPKRPIRIVVPNSPGSGADIVTRLVGNMLTAAWGQHIVIDNRAGASGNIAAEIGARAAPDGYTLLMITSQQSIVAAMFDKLNYDLVKDYSPISLLASAPHILVVHPSVPASSVKELIALAKSKPGQLNYASSGAGTGVHLATEVFKNVTGTDMVHVPYKGTAPALTGTMSDQVQLTIMIATAVLPAIKSGKVRALGVTSLKRTPLAPDVPTISEFVPGYEWTGWYGLAAPRGTPREIITKLYNGQLNALKTAEFQERLTSLGADPIGTTPEEYAAHIRRQVEKMRVAIKVSGAKPD